MDNVINPELRDLERRLFRLEGHIEEIRSSGSNISRQTIWQFIAFTLTMAGVLIGSNLFQTEALGRETVARMEAVNQRFEQVDRRFEQIEKRLDKIEKAIEDLRREFRASRSGAAAR